MAGRRVTRMARWLASALLAAVAAIGFALLSRGTAAADEPTTGSITITMNQAVNQEDQDFEFTGCLGEGCGTFVLNPADGNGSTPRTTTGTGLAPGTYTVTQTAIPHWSLKSLTCDTGETVSLAERRATIVLTSGEDVHCTFTTQTQKLGIVLDTTPDSALDFEFTGCAGTDCGPFTLDDDDDDPTLERSINAVGLAPGTYVITQTADAPLPLASISCNTGESINLAARRLTVTISPNERVSCVFRNQAPGITIIQDSVPDDGHDVRFTGCLGSGCADFLLDDDTDATVPRSLAGEGMAAGTYTVTQTADADWPLTSITCTTGESVDLANRRVTITLGEAERTSCTFKNTAATLTLVEDTTPDGPQDFTLERCDGETCVDVTLDDDFDDTHPTTTGEVPLPPGTYTVTAPEVDGFELTSVECATSEAVGLDARRVTISLSASEQQTCTFGHRPIPPPLTDVVQITTNLTGSCARLTSGEARCWGDNEFGRLGDGSVSPSPVPAVVSDTTGAGPLAGVSDLSAGFSHTCAVLDTGQARCWGWSGNGALGDGTTTAARERPTTVSNETGTGPLTSVTRIVTGGNHTCALLTTGQARCWGDAGVVGDGTSVMRTLPVPVSNPDGTGPLTGITQISARLGHTCALLDTGEAVCWGSNNAGQLGDGTTTARTRPVVVSDPTGTGPLTGIERIEAGYVNTCALLDSGEARCWGQNTHGELGDGTTTGRTRPVPVLDPSGTAPLAGIDAISGGTTNCAHQENGETYCWGQAFDGGQAQPLPVLRTNGTGDGPLADVAELTSGDGANCALLTSGQVRCWGDSWGRLGDGTSVSRARPVAVIDPRSELQPLTGVDQLSTGRTHSCAVLVIGEARCWGEGRALGNPDVTRSNVTVPVRDVDGSGPLTDITQISAGTGHTCAVLTNHEARCWGADSIGDGTGAARSLPTVVLDEDGSGPLTGVSSIAAGADGTCAVLSNTEARCWGSDHGPLPTVVVDVDGVGPLTGVIDISMDYDWSYAALSDGRLVRWAGPHAPVPVIDPGSGTAFEDAVAVTAGSAAVCVTRTNGQVGCLGEVSNPEGTGPLTDVVDVESSDTHSCATLSTGEARCWGANNGFGELGVPPPTTSPHSIVVHDPAADGPLLGARTIETGLFSTCVLFDNGAVKCWGLNNAGALGDGTEVASRFEPVAVMERTDP